MRVLDCLRLGVAGVKAHKKRALTVVAIVGLLFSVLMAGAFFLQGLENAALGKMLAPTGGKVLVMSNVDTKFCGEECDTAKEVAEIRRNIERYGGEAISATMISDEGVMFYRLEKNVFEFEGEGLAIPLSTVAKMKGVQLPGWDAGVERRVEVVQTIFEEAKAEDNENRIVGILPGGVYTSDLSLSSVEQSGNPLNMIFGQIVTGTSQNFVIGATEVSEGSGVDAVSEIGAVSEMDTAEMGLVFAEFPDLKAAYNYYRDEANYCLDLDRAFGHCKNGYKYLTMSAVSDPLKTYDNFQLVWLVFGITAAVLAVIALIIAVSTYARLIGKDMKIIALYHAMGATRGQVRLVYLSYLLILSVMTVVFSLVVGLGMALLLGAVNGEAISQVFWMGFGVEPGKIWLVGWNWMIWVMVAVILLSAVLAILLSNGQFASKKLARKMK